MNLKDSQKLLNGRSSKIIDHNTILHQTTDGIKLRYYKTDILHFHINQDIIVDTNGYRTISTKKRLNKYLPEGFSIKLIKGVWYWNNGNVFNDGDKIKTKHVVRAYDKK